MLKKYFGSVPRSFVTALEATVGGVEWGEEIVHPLCTSGQPLYVIAGLSLLISILFSTFCLWNLVLGIYVRQVILIAKEYDQQVEQRDLLESENDVHEMREMLDSLDGDGDGFISTREVREVADNPEALKSLGGISANELEVLHAALDTEGRGMVGVSELLFGVLKLSGTSATIDMLSIDYRQKVFLRDVTNLEKSSSEELKRLTVSLEKVVGAAYRLKDEMHGLRAGIDQAKQDLLAEIAREDAQLAEAQRDAAEVVALEQAQYLKRNGNAREAIKTHLEELKVEACELAQARGLEELCDGSRQNAEQLRSAVRRRLQTQLGPWLRFELLEAGGIR